MKYKKVIKLSAQGMGAGLFDASKGVWIGTCNNGENTPKMTKYLNEKRFGPSLDEFGHFLGLRDTDGLSGVTSGTHKTIMGYSRWLTGGSEGRLNYQDIQGIAIANSNHTHNYMRYVANGSNRTYICFYCDAYSNPTTDN